MGWEGGGGGVGRREGVTKKNSKLAHMQHEEPLPFLYASIQVHFHVCNFAAGRRIYTSVQVHLTVTYI